MRFPLQLEKMTRLMEAVCGHCTSSDREFAGLQDQAEAASSKAGAVKP